MDSLETSVDPISNPALAVSVASIPRPPRVWKFWGTALWGLLIFAAMFLGQLAVVVF